MWTSFRWVQHWLQRGIERVSDAFSLRRETFAQAQVAYGVWHGLFVFGLGGHRWWIEDPQQVRSVSQWIVGLGYSGVSDL